MSGDPYRIFEGASDSKRDVLKSIWPDLFNALARVGDSRPTRSTLCALLATHGVDNRPAAVARVTLNGHPGCAPCIAATSDRPGGYPLKLVTPENLKDYR